MTQSQPFAHGFPLLQSGRQFSSRTRPLSRTSLRQRFVEKWWIEAVETASSDRSKHSVAPHSEIGRDWGDQVVGDNPGIRLRR